MTIRLFRRRCRKCEGPIHWVNNNLYCDRCGTQPPHDRAGNPIVSRETPEGDPSLGGVGGTPYVPSHRQVPYIRSME